MKLDFKDILETQRILDETIHRKHNTNYEKVYDELKLALFVELGELANEVKCFKFWSVKGPSERSIILEEYVDGIHFIGALAIAKGVDGTFIIDDSVGAINDKKALTEVFNNLFKKMDSLDNSVGIKEWFYEYLILGYQLGFTYDDIYKAYFKKNQINFQRQKENY